ncbi:MAG: FIG00443700: hypothetical protein, partial [uncultured Thiotrichaceae bacterium]
PRHAEYTEDGKRLWVSAEIGGTVTVFNTEDQSEITKISFEIAGVHRDKIQPVGVELNKDNSLAFVALGPANHIAVVDTKTYEVLKYILVGKRVWHMAFSPDYKHLFTTNGVSGDVSVIDLEKLEAVKAIKVGRFPWGIAARPTNN